jgi:hypothetical protein
MSGARGKRTSREILRYAQDDGGPSEFPFGQFSSYEILYSRAKLITSGAESFDAHDSRCFQLGRIGYSPVQLALRAIEPWASGSRHIADGDYVVKVLADEFLNRFRTMLRYVYADLAHHLDRDR